MVSSDLSSAEKENTAVIAHLTGTPTVADCFYKESDNGYHVITKLDKGSLAIDTSFDPTPCAKAITDFTDNDILVSLQNNASQGVVWVEGIEHPTFSWDLTNRLADYTAVNVALDKVPQDISVYTDETVSVLKQAIDSVDTSLSAAEQSKVDAMAQAIEDAIAALQYKDADKTTPAPAATATPAPAATATPQYTIPQTGDTSNPALLVVLMLVSGSAAIGTAVVASKRKNNR